MYHLLWIVTFQQTEYLLRINCFSTSQKGDRGSKVVKALCYKSEGHWFDPSGFFIDIKYFRSHYGPGAESASNRNEYQEYFLGVKVADA